MSSIGSKLPLVFVVTPTFNEAAFLREAIETHSLGTTVYRMPAVDEITDTRAAVLGELLRSNLVRAAAKPTTDSGRTGFAIGQRKVTGLSNPG
jgi:hypothetical protein